MHERINVASIALVLALGCMNSASRAEDRKAEPAASESSSNAGGTVASARVAKPLPCEAFTIAPAKRHDPSALLFPFDQLEYWYRVPGEFTHRLDGDRYGFETLSFIISETHPGGGPGLHVPYSEEAHVLLKGSVRYRIGKETFTVEAPYVAKVPAGVAHTFINAGTEPFNLIAVFATKHPVTTRIGPNPLIPEWESAHGTAPCTGAVR